MFNRQSGENMHSLLIANRGEVALRIARSARSMGLKYHGIYASDDKNCYHVELTSALPLSGSGPAAYMNQQEILDLALKHDSAIHPGYGFLSENWEFAEKCDQAGVVFIGPTPETLATFGNKGAALELARKSQVPCLMNAPIRNTEEAKEFLKQNGPMMLKAVSGGGGRGMRIVRQEAEVEDALAACQREGSLATGNSEIYAEEMLEPARHLEVQVLGDGHDAVSFGLRDCSFQRRHQKIIEIAPPPELDQSLADMIQGYALKLARASQLSSLATFEFLLHPDSQRIVFIEANPRLQVEHTVTEEIYDVDLVELQLKVAAGKTISSLSLQDVSPRIGYAAQFRINMESMSEDGQVLPAQGMIATFSPPRGSGIRIESHAYPGYDAPANYDSLIAKVIVYSRSNNPALLWQKSRAALSELVLAGPRTNQGILRSLLEQPFVQNFQVDTGLLDRNAKEILSGLLPDPSLPQSLNSSQDNEDSEDIAHEYEEFHEGLEEVRSPMSGQLLEVRAREGDRIYAGESLALLSAMKMENEISSPCSGFVEKVFASAQDSVKAESILMLIRPVDDESEQTQVSAHNMEQIRPDLQEVIHRHSLNEDAHRVQARNKRHKRKQNTARENIARLCDEDSFIEYGALALAAQRRRRSLEELIRLSPADGLITGLATVNAKNFGAEKARCAVMSYDYTVFAGTQGAFNHKKTDRLIHVVQDLGLPFILLTEGGGGRPGEVDVPAVAGLDIPTFRQFAALKGRSLRVAIADGRCFAGNAALFGASDIRIATREATIGMGGPVMIKGGGLGSYRAEDVGPAEMHHRTGVVDILSENDSEAVTVAQQCLSYFQGNITPGPVADQRILRHLIPENRKRTYDIHDLIKNLCDESSFLELKGAYGKSIITGFIRIQGRPLGLLASNPNFLAGAIDANAADKAASFLRLCDSGKLPVLSLCDTPGFMVGPEAESQALVRFAPDFFSAAAEISVPMFTVILRRGYGLGAMAMAGGSFHAPVFTVSWPTGEFGAMGLEGEVKLGFQKELAEIRDWDERHQRYEELLAQALERGKAINMASYLEIDGVIDPAETRTWVQRGLESLGPSV